MASERIIRSAYDGLYEITHNPDAKGSQPRYLVENTKTQLVTNPQGVTTIIGGTLAKDFVGWALDCMEKDVLGAMGRRAALDEELTEEDIAEAKLASTRRRDDGASVGSEAHAMIEHY